jgi:hypothetical protein
MLEALTHVGYDASRVKLLLNRSNAFTGISVQSAEGALKRTIEHKISNEYRIAISAQNSGDPFMHSKSDSPLGRELLEFARAIDKVLGPAAAATAPTPVVATR